MDKFKRKQVKRPARPSCTKSSIATPISMSGIPDAEGVALEYYIPCAGTLQGVRINADFTGADKVGLVFDHLPGANAHQKRSVNVEVPAGDQVVDVELEVKAGDLFALRHDTAWRDASNQESELKRVRIAFIHSVKYRGQVNAEHTDA